MLGFTEQKKYLLLCTSNFRYFVDDEVLSRVPNLFLLLGAIWGAMELITLPFIRDPTEEEMSQLEKVHFNYIS